MKGSLGHCEGLTKPKGREAGVPGPTLTARPPQVHGRGTATTASLHIPAFRGGPAELPRGAAGAAGGQADAAARPAPVPVRGLRGDAGEPAAAARGEGLSISVRGLIITPSPCSPGARIKWVRPSARRRAWPSLLSHYHHGPSLLREAAPPRCSSSLFGEENPGIPQSRLYYSHSSDEKLK